MRNKFSDQHRQFVSQPVRLSTERGDRDIKFLFFIGVRYGGFKTFGQKFIKVRLNKVLGKIISVKKKLLECFEIALQKQVIR